MLDGRTSALTVPKARWGWHKSLTRFCISTNQPSLTSRHYCPTHISFDRAHRYMREACSPLSSDSPYPSFRQLISKTRQDKLWQDTVLPANAEALFQPDDTRRRPTARRSMGDLSLRPPIRPPRFSGQAFCRTGANQTTDNPQSKRRQGCSPASSGNLGSFMQLKHRKAGQAQFQRGLC